MVTKRYFLKMKDMAIGQFWSIFSLLKALAREYVDTCELSIKAQAL